MSDICLILEGTYPYVQGGVSSWVHQIIKGMPDLKFTVLSIMPSPVDTKIERYEIPSNVQSIMDICVHDYRLVRKPFRRKTKKLFEFFEMFFRGIHEVSVEEMEKFLLQLIKNRNSLDLDYAFSSRAFWKAVTDLYYRGDPTISFLDYFWNYRFTFLPIMQILKARIPPSPLYHTISTGYAGVASSLAKVEFNSNMILTEHGIYTKERRIEIAQASWIYERETEYVKATEELGFFKDWWIRCFSSMSRIAYAYADRITTLFEGNRQLQIADGAEIAKTMIIPNGVEIGMFKKIADLRRRKQRRRNIAFVGRIVLIKDVKTLLKACKIVVQRLPDLKIFLIGPQEEQSHYYQDCLFLIKMLGLEKHVIITGHVDVKEYYPEIDLIVLTSISEAQPLVILEAAACGIPTVASDVGSCRELLEGVSEEDKKLGKSGIICPFHSAPDTADAIVKLLTDDDLYESMSEVGRKRVTKYYDIKDMINSYRNLYEQYI